eukprot:m.480573 g.480573  ORF g.480573 m.480573 type:complete len:300 (+) comp21893_c0_seq1:262-1161(+)
MGYSTGVPAVVVGCFGAALVILVWSWRFMNGRFFFQDVRLAHIAWLVRACYVSFFALLMKQFSTSPNPIYTDGFGPVKLNGDDVPNLSLHPVFMSLGFIVCMSEALMAYKGSPVCNFSHSNAKAFHAVANVLSLAFASTGVGIVFNFRHKIYSVLKYEDLSSAHSILGFVTFLLHIFQFFSGFFFFYVWKNDAGKAKAVKFHRVWGFIVYISGVAAVMSGIAQTNASGPATSRDAPIQRSQVLTIVGWSVALFVHVLLYGPDEGSARQGAGAGHRGSSHRQPLNNADPDVAYAAMESDS